MRAVILLSGGLDSCVSATLAKEECDEIYAITFFYGQRHSKEVESARSIGRYLGVKEHKFIEIDPSVFTTSSLVDKRADIEERRIEDIGENIPSTYVPARNTIFLSYALAFAESRNIDCIYIGANALDYSGYPDCRPEYIRAFQKVADLGTKRGIEGKRIEIKSPLINMRKKEIVELGVKMKAPLHLTWSCYRGGKRACGRCDSCLLRLRGFMEAGYEDPIEYEQYPDWYNRENLKSINH